MALEPDELWRVYAETGAGAEAPVYRAIAHAVAADPELLAVATAAPPAAQHPNHLLAAVRYLLVDEPDDLLADAYARRDPVIAVERFGTFVRRHRDALLEVLEERRVQTNEVGRIAVIAAALAHVAHHVREPLAVVDVGTSAGLNLLVDRAHVIPDGDAPGPAVPSSPTQLRITCRMLGAAPAVGASSFTIGWRAGLDRAPVDLDDPGSARWLESCVWIDHPDRIEQLHRAIELRRHHHWPVITGDAVDDLAPVLAQAPDGHHLVALTTWVAFYLDRDARRRLVEVIGRAGRPASWISLEHPGVIDLPTPPVPPDHQVVPSAVGLVTFDGTSAEPARQFLGWAHPHGRWIDWHADR